MVKRTHLSDSCFERETIAFHFSYNGSWEKVPAVVRDQEIFLNKGSILLVFLHQFQDNNLTSFLHYLLHDEFINWFIYPSIYLFIWETFLVCGTWPVLYGVGCFCCYGLVWFCMWQRWWYVGGGYVHAHVHACRG